MNKLISSLFLRSHITSSHPLDERLFCYCHAAADLKSARGVQMQSLFGQLSPGFLVYFLAGYFFAMILTPRKAGRTSTGDLPQALNPASGFWLGKTGYAVILSGCSNKISAIKCVRAAKPHLGLKEAKELVDSAPAVIGVYLTSAEAWVVEQAFVAAGAEVEIREARVEKFTEEFISSQGGDRAVSQSGESEILPSGQGNQ